MMDCKFMDISIKLINDDSSISVLKIVTFCIYVLFIYEAFKLNIHLSKSEILFMNKKSILFRNVCINMFVFIGIYISNYVLLKYDDILFVAIGIIIGAAIYLVKEIVNKGKNGSYKVAIISLIWIIISSFMCVWLKIFGITNCNIVAAIISAIISTILFNLIFDFCNEPDEWNAQFYITDKAEKWYIYRIINNEFMICGTEIDKYKNSKIKIFDLKSIDVINKVSKKEENSVDKKEKASK